MAVSDIPCYCIRLRRLSGAIDAIYEDAFEGTGVTIGQFSLLYNIGQLGTCSISALSSHVGLERTTVVRSLKPLEAAGFVTDEAPAGARDRMIRLTEAGERKVQECMGPWESAQEKAASALGSDGVELIDRLVGKLFG